MSPLVLALNSGDEADVVVRMLLGKGAAVTKAEAMEKRWDFEPCAWEVKGLSFMMEGILANEALRRAEGVDSEDEVEAVETGNGDESEESSSESSWV